MYLHVYLFKLCINKSQCIYLYVISSNPIKWVEKIASKNILNKSEYQSKPLIVHITDLHTICFFRCIQRAKKIVTHSQYVGITLREFHKDHSD